MQAEWKIKGIYKADAQKVADEIGEKSITPQEVLEKAKDENSELHKCFEWNNDVAAEKYRLQQARAIIINLVYTPKEKEEQTVRCFQITTERSVYQPTKQFLVQENEYQSLLARAKAELESFRKRYSTLTELEQVFEQIDILTA
jgi:hypothetical protein